ncbi:MAG: hypothetical protein PHP37_00225 [Patescibacteria group bacterium]|nr:hypothetical protein [Patescibacteria group bacterium]
MKNFSYFFLFLYFRFGMFSRRLKKVNKKNKERKMAQFNPQEFYGKRWPDVKSLLSLSPETEGASASFLNDIDEDQRIFELS